MRENTPEEAGFEDGAAEAEGIAVPAVAERAGQNVFGGLETRLFYK